MFKIGDEYLIARKPVMDLFGAKYPEGSIFTVSRVDADGDACDDSDGFYITPSDVEDGFAVKVEGEGISHEGTVIIPEEQKHSHYFKEWNGKIDIYRLLLLYKVNDPCLQHAIKKLLCTGERGHKDFRKDIEDAIDTLTRRLEMLDEDSEKG